MKNKAGLLDTLLLALMLALLMVGGHQTYVVGKAEGFRMGFFKSYWIFMLVLVLAIIYQIRKNSRPKQEEGPVARSEAGKKKNVKKSNK